MDITDGECNRGIFCIYTVKSLYNLHCQAVDQLVFIILILIKKYRICSFVEKLG